MRFQLGQRLFPNLPPDLRRRRMQSIYLTVLVLIVVCGAICLVMIKLNTPGKH